MPMSAGVAYSKVAASYDTAPNPVVALEARILSSLLRVDGRRVLDAGCGTGRWTEYLAGRDVPAWGVDASEAMLSEARRKPAIAGRCLQGDIRRLPFRDDAFDVAICSFVLGYAQDIGPILMELARVAPTVIITDLHPEAVSRGWKREFPTPQGKVDIEHFPYTARELERAADEANLSLASWLNVPFGEPEREIYRAAGKEEIFEESTRIPAVLIAKWKR